MPAVAEAPAAGYLWKMSPAEKTNPVLLKSIKFSRHVDGTIMIPVVGQRLLSSAFVGFVVEMLEEGKKNKDTFY